MTQLITTIAELRSAINGSVLQNSGTIGGPRAVDTELPSTEHSDSEQPDPHPLQPPRQPPVLGLVPTMGALHSGHASLFRAARETSDLMLVSVFVNPLQFDDPDDFTHYPRDLTKDLDLAAQYGADIVFAPELEEMYPGYPDTPQVRVTTGEMGRRFEGAWRPGHFDGVATVVTKLFNAARPRYPAQLQAWFGQKDAEQVAIIRRLNADLNLGAQVRVLPTVRDENGLALSSRNQRLSASDYRAALAIPGTLFTLKERVTQHQEPDLAGLRRQVDQTRDVELDYLTVVDPSTLLQLPEAQIPHCPGALALIAARVGPVRLIDNLEVTPGV